MCSSDLSSREAMIFLTASRGCSDGKKNRHKRDVGCFTVENIDVCICPGSTRVVLMFGHLYLSNTSVVSHSLEGTRALPRIELITKRLVQRDKSCFGGTVVGCAEVT